MKQCAESQPVVPAAAEVCDVDILREKRRVMQRDRLDHEYDLSVLNKKAEHRIPPHSIT